MSQSRKPRVQKRTLLLVGEGRDQEAFLKYLKSRLVSRGAGLVVTIKNAKGKGAKHVIEWTIKQAANAAYDEIGVLFDTDTDCWTPMVEQQAKKNNILLLKSEPCFEAMMLRMLGKNPETTTEKLKKQFSPFVDGDATESENYAKHFGLEMLSAYQHKEPAIKQLLTLLPPMP